jgi:sugar lactone lactonase YvrE
VLRAFGLVKVSPGQSVYISDESEQQTYSATVDDEGTLKDVRLFADRGGEGAAVDARGNVFLAAGQILVFDAKGKPIETIRVPERPVQIVFGGPDGKTLFIAARSSLYAVRTRFAGR